MKHNETIFDINRLKNIYEINYLQPKTKIKKLPPIFHPPPKKTIIFLLQLYIAKKTYQIGWESGVRSTNQPLDPSKALKTCYFLRRLYSWVDIFLLQMLHSPETTFFFLLIIVFKSIKRTNKWSVKLGNKKKTFVFMLK